MVSTHSLPPLPCLDTEYFQHERCEQVLALIYFEVLLVQSERLLIVLGHAQKGGLVVLHERLVYRALGIGSDAAEASVGHSELFEASLVEEYPVTEELELSALQVGGEI